MGRTYTIVRFFQHRLRAKRWDAFHSPYLFRLFTYCCDEKIVNDASRAIEQYRRQLKTSVEPIQLQDFGAGSVWSKQKKAMPIGTIAKHALSWPFQCRFLSRLAAITQPKHVIELGTSFGVTAAYLATGAPEALIDTIEGDPVIARYAAAFFKAHAYASIRLHSTTFEFFLHHWAQSPNQVDLAFLDGHHTAAALTTYYDALKPSFHSNTIVVVDDIYWSEDMHHGWMSLCQKQEITQSVDCFHFGLLFFNPDFRNKEHHTVKLPLRMLWA